MSVNIYEQALKSAVDLEDAVTVYVPGYANFGPETPTLCQSLTEFEGIYGSTPYFFEEDQTESKIIKDSPEKGYLYAKGLLASGLNVIFHRFKASGVETAKADLVLSYKLEKDGEALTYNLVAQAISFGRGYIGTKVELTKLEENLYSLTIYSSAGEKVYTGNVSLDPSSALYIKLVNLPLIKFKAKDSRGNIVDIEDAKMELISSGFEHSFTGANADKKVSVEITYVDNGDPEFYVDDKTITTTVEGKNKEKKITGMLSSLADPSGMLYPLTDFEVFPSVTYITSGGYYIGAAAAGNMLSVADQIKSIALIDYNFGLDVKDVASWKTAQSALAAITGSATAKGKGATFIGCNSFEVAPYRLVLGDSFNYLKCLGENIKNGIAAWIPVANDPNGVSPCGYDTTNKIDTALSEIIAEGKIGVSANPIIYSTSAGGYKIMGNRTLLSNTGVLAPNSFLNVSVVVNRVERAARQSANKLKIVSTNPQDTFQRFKNAVSKTLDPMVVSGDGLLSYKIKMLPKTEAATINIQIALVVVEGIETFNIYVPYSISLD